MQADLKSGTMRQELSSLENTHQVIIQTTPVDNGKHFSAPVKRRMSQ